MSKSFLPPFYILSLAILNFSTRLNLPTKHNERAAHYYFARLLVRLSPHSPDFVRNPMSYQAQLSVTGGEILLSHNFHPNGHDVFACEQACDITDESGEYVIFCVSFFDSIFTWPRIFHGMQSKLRPFGRVNSPPIYTKNYIQFTRFIPNCKLFLSLARQFCVVTHLF